MKAPLVRVIGVGILWYTGILTAILVAGLQAVVWLAHGVTVLGLPAWLWYLNAVAATAAFGLALTPRQQQRKRAAVHRLAAMCGVVMLMAIFTSSFALGESPPTTGALTTLQASFQSILIGMNRVALVAAPGIACLAEAVGALVDIRAQHEDDPNLA